MLKKHGVKSFQKFHLSNYKVLGESKDQQLTYKGITREQKKRNSSLSFLDQKLGIKDFLKTAASTAKEKMKRSFNGQL